MSFESEYAISY